MNYTDNEQKESFSKPHDIYPYLINQVSLLIAKVSDQNSSHIEFKKRAKLVLDELFRLKSTFIKRINYLKDQSEWERYTISFFGETNAGKSTIIEVLRILFEDDGKLECKLKIEQQNRLISDIKLKRIETLETLKHQNQCKVENLTNTLYENEAKIDGLKDEISKNRELLIIENDERLKDWSEKLEYHYKVVSVRKQAFWFRFICWFRKIIGLLPLEIKRKEKNNIDNALRLCELYDVENEDVIKKLNNDVYSLETVARSDIQQRLNACLEYNPNEDLNIRIIDEQIQLIVQQINEYKDGGIIGTGMQDFTKDCIEYCFNQQIKPFTLIDVPGIEGDEGEYEQMIFDSVSKAHVVFYVTTMGKLPELGTIAKIKKYLKNQSEVYVILNARKINYLEDEISGNFYDLHQDARLFEVKVSELMKVQLGAFYKGCVSIQGLMAFCSMADISPFQERNLRYQAKWNKMFDGKEVMLQVSNLAVLESLISKLIQSIEGKIIVANLQKTLVAVSLLNENISIIRASQYSDDILRVIYKEFSDFKAAIERFRSDLVDDITNLSKIQINSAVSQMQESFYNAIDGKEVVLTIDDWDRINLIDDKKERFNVMAECICRFVLDQIEEEYKNRATDMVGAFSTNIEGAYRKMTVHISQMQMAFNGLAISDSFLEVGGALLDVDWKKMFLGAVGIASMSMTGGYLGAFLGGPIGAAIGAVIGALLSLVSSLFGESKESKAKKKVSEELRNNIKPKLEEQFNISDEKIIQECDKCISSIYEQLDNEIANFKGIQCLLDDKVSDLVKIIKNIELKMKDK